MAEYTLLIAVAILIAVSVLAYKILKGIAKAAMLIMALSCIALGIAGALVVMDANNLKQKFATEPNLVLVIAENQVISAIDIENGTARAATFGFEGKSAPTGQELDKAAEGYYKLIIINAAALDNPDLEKIQAMSRTERVAYLTPMIQKLFSDVPAFMHAYKEGTVQVHEETAMFRAIRLLPISMLKSAGRKMLQKTTAAVVEKIA